MRHLEVRRHAYTKKGADRGTGSHLSQAGVDLARRIGETTGPFDAVVTSTVPRTLETALAMGFAVDALREDAGLLTAAFWAEVPRHGHWDWYAPFVRYRELLERGGAVATLGRAQRAMWLGLLASVRAEGAVLVVSHGHVMEAGLVACGPPGVIGDEEQPFAHGEGFRAAVDDEGRFRDVRLLRVAHE